MRITVSVDDELFARAAALAAPDIKGSALLRECVKAYVAQQSARRLAMLGGKAHEVELAPRRRPRSNTTGQ